MGSVFAGLLGGSGLLGSHPSVSRGGLDQRMLVTPAPIMKDS